MNISVSPAMISLVVKKVRQQQNALGIDKNKIHIYEQLPYPMDAYGLHAYVSTGIFSEPVVELCRIPSCGADFDEWCMMTYYHGGDKAKSIAEKMSQKIKNDMLPNYKYSNTDLNAKYVKSLYSAYQF